MRLVLEITSGPLAGQQIEAKTGETVSIGRTPKATNPIADNFMSGAHFAVECKANNCVLRDLNSRNGTKLNDELVTESVLKSGDLIHAGRTDFLVRIETTASEPAAASKPDLKPGKIPTGPVQQKASNRDKQPLQVTPPASPVSKPAPENKPARHQVTSVESAPQPGPPSPSASEQPPPPPAALVPAVELDPYEAATPDGRLFQILSNQSHSLMALVDAVHDERVLELLRNTREEYQSLYRPEQNPRIAPYLVRLPPRSEFLKQMIQRGWGHQWGVYLTCQLSLAELRQYFRTSLMVAMPDGMELFSRFYDPVFFRTFLETCTAAEAEKFFGPINSYLMEDERPEILLEFRRGKNGADKKGHLLSDLS